MKEDSKLHARWYYLEHKDKWALDQIALERQREYSRNYYYANKERFNGYRKKYAAKSLEQKLRETADSTAETYTKHKEYLKNKEIDNARKALEKENSITGKTAVAVENKRRRMGVKKKLNNCGSYYLKSQGFSWY